MCLQNGFPKSVFVASREHGVETGKKCQLCFSYSQTRGGGQVWKARERACAHIGGAGHPGSCQKAQGLLLGFLSPLPHLRAFRSRNPLNQGWSTAGHTTIWASASGNLRLSSSCLKGSSENASCLPSRDLKTSDLGEVASGHRLSLAG